MNTIDEAIEILKAMKEGKEIQMLRDGRWLERQRLAGGMPDFKYCTYRIKPEPREIWVNVYPHNQLGGTHATREDADRWCSGDGRAVRFREVIEE